MTADDSDSRSSAGRLTDPLLRLDGVTAGYGATTVLRDVSVDVGDGEVVGIVGRNGVGKTTTLRTVMGTLTPRSGAVTYDGEDISDLDPEETVSRGIALVPEERRIFGGLSVRENLELAELGGTDGNRGRGWTIAEVFDTFENLADNERAAGSTLSAGNNRCSRSVGRSSATPGRSSSTNPPRGWHPTSSNGSSRRSRRSETGG